MLSAQHYGQWFALPSGHSQSFYNPGSLGLHPFGAGHQRAGTSVVAGVPICPQRTSLVGLSCSRAGSHIAGPRNGNRPLYGCFDHGVESTARPEALTGYLVSIPTSTTNKRPGNGGNVASSTRLPLSSQVPHGPSHLWQCSSHGIHHTGSHTDWPVSPSGYSNCAAGIAYS